MFNGFPVTKLLNTSSIYLRTLFGLQHASFRKLRRFLYLMQFCQSQRRHECNLRRRISSLYSHKNQRMVSDALGRSNMIGVIRIGPVSCRIVVPKLLGVVPHFACQNAILAPPPHTHTQQWIANLWLDFLIDSISCQMSILVFSIVIII